MIDSVLHAGDEVTITIEQEKRDWGYNPCPDGTRATVVGFSEIIHGRLGNLGLQPGVYANKAWVKLLLENGRALTEWSGRLELVDQDEYNRRVEQWWNNDWRSEKEYIRALPPTPFWEGDKIRVHLETDLPEVCVVTSIDYADLNNSINVGTKWPAYKISDKLGSGWYISASEDNLELVERGNVWKFFHNEPLEFTDLKEEAEFFQMLGHTEEVRNPANGLYRWTKDEVLEAIAAGTVHGFSMSSGFFGSGSSIQANRFRDEDLGRRVAQATLEGFHRTSA